MCPAARTGAGRPKGPAAATFANLLRSGGAARSCPHPTAAQPRRAMARRALALAAFLPPPLTALARRARVPPPPLRRLRACAQAPPPAAAAQPGVLYVVSTPIGNAGDITRRAVAILSSVDVIAAEDTRRTGLLLVRVLPPAADRGPGPALVSCHAHNWRARAPGLVARLRAGESVAVVSDAGTPAVSDPGAELAAAAVAAGVRVVPVPGACAALAALAVAALPPGVDFVVAGFLPRSGRARADALARVAGAYAAAAVVLYEAPHRLAQTLADLAAAEADGGPRTVVLGREVTKRYEEFLRYACAADAAAEYAAAAGGGAAARAARGEFTVVVGPCAPARAAAAGGEVSAEAAIGDAVCEARALVAALVAAGTPTSVVAKAVAATSGLSRKAVYAYASQVKDELRGSGGAPAV